MSSCLVASLCILQAATALGQSWVSNSGSSVGWAAEQAGWASAVRQTAWVKDTGDSTCAGCETKKECNKLDCHWSSDLQGCFSSCDLVGWGYDCSCPKDLKESKCVERGCAYNGDDDECSEQQDPTGDPTCPNTESGTTCLRAGCVFDVTTNTCQSTTGPDGDFLCPPDVSEDHCGELGEPCAFVEGECVSGETEPVCLDLSTQEDCEAQDGCAWDTVSMTCIDDPVSACSNNEDQTTCEADALGCTWDGTDCIETPAACDDNLDQTTCEADVLGCTWDGTDCIVTPAACDDNLDQTTCEADVLGCLWNGTDCTPP